jgi:hypothetical protein
MEDNVAQEKSEEDVPVENNCGISSNWSVKMQEILTELPMVKEEKEMATLVKEKANQFFKGTSIEQSSLLPELQFKSKMNNTRSPPSCIPNVFNLTHWLPTTTGTDHSPTSKGNCTGWPWPMRTGPSSWTRHMPR